MIRRPPRSTLDRSSAASDVYKRQGVLPGGGGGGGGNNNPPDPIACSDDEGNPVSIYAVSYTHLRAHETVLDIVCRLLLEKKKKKKNHHINYMHDK